MKFSVVLLSLTPSSSSVAYSAAAAAGFSIVYFSVILNNSG